MEIVVIHSHLNPGGVTRIIESQVESLKDFSVKVCTGSCDNPEKITKAGASFVEFKPLNYLSIKKYTKEETQSLLNEILDFFNNHLNRHSILHVHNLNLGKNPVVTYAVFQLAKKGFPVFNHAHDFAEDRPRNLQFLKEIIVGNFGAKLNEVLYPSLPNYHFGVLNSFDRKRLESYGVQKERILWLPNPVTFEAKLDISKKPRYKTEICKQLKLEENKKLITYPVRVIERKNIGEFILLSVFFGQEANFVVTQPPKNPAEIELYNKWVNFCQNNNINIIFAAGQKVDFEKLLIASDFCITTSYKEGFGMVYLEPWLLNTPVVGRNIEFLTRDFRAEEFQFPSLYNELNVPSYETDFKNLNMETQMKIISDLKKNKINKSTFFKQNPSLKSLFNKVDDKIIDDNVSIIKNYYSTEKYGIKLQKRYKEMVG